MGDELQRFTVVFAGGLNPLSPDDQLLAMKMPIGELCEVWHLLRDNPDMSFRQACEARRS